MDVNWDQMISLGIQVPLVLLTMWFALKMAHDNRVDTATRDKGWQDFLIAERAQRKESMEHGLRAMADVSNRSSDGITKMTEAVTGLARSIGDHDRAAADRYMKLVDTIRENECRSPNQKVQ